MNSPISDLHPTQSPPDTLAAMEPFKRYFIWTAHAGASRGLRDTQGFYFIDRAGNGGIDKVSGEDAYIGVKFTPSSEDGSIPEMIHLKVYVGIGSVEKDTVVIDYLDDYRRTLYCVIYNEFRVNHWGLPYWDPFSNFLEDLSKYPSPKPELAENVIVGLRDIQRLARQQSSDLGGENGNHS